MWATFVFLPIAFALVIQPIVNFVMAQAPNTTLPESRKNTMAIVNLKDNTVTLVDKITNETISVKNLTGTAGTTTTNETLGSNTGNMTTNETLTLEKTTINETPATNKAGNTTTNINLTDKFDALQGK